MSYWICGNCKIWVEAAKCAGNDTTNIRVFVHEDHLPTVTSYFEFLSSAENRNCWSIDPSDSKVCLPKEENLEDTEVWIYFGSPDENDEIDLEKSYPFEDCTECENADDDGGSGGGSGKGKRGGTGIWPPYRSYNGDCEEGEDCDDGDQDPTDPDPGQPNGRPATVCSGHEARAVARGWDVDNLYVRGDVSQEVYSIGGICVSVSGSVQEIPGGSYTIGIGRSEYDSCSDCTDGYKAEGCDGHEDAPVLWIRKGDKGSMTGFAKGNYCYQISETVETIPEDGRVIEPSKQIACNECNQGVPYRSCLTNDPSRYWAEEEEVNNLASELSASHVYMRINGICYSLYLGETTADIPKHARKIKPRCEFLDCDACNCTGEKSEECADPIYGWAVQACEPDAGVVWLEEDNETIPTNLRGVFEYDSRCFFLDRTKAKSKIPDDAIIADPDRWMDGSYFGCSQCQQVTGDNPFDDDPAFDHPPGDPERPDWADGEGDDPCDDPDNTIKICSYVNDHPCWQYPPGHDLRPWWCGGNLSENDPCNQVPPPPYCYGLPPAIAEFGDLGDGKIVNLKTLCETFGIASDCDADSTYSSVTNPIGKNPFEGLVFKHDGNCYTLGEAVEPTSGTDVTGDFLEHQRVWSPAGGLRPWTLAECEGELACRVCNLGCSSVEEEFSCLYRDWQQPLLISGMDGIYTAMNGTFNYLGYEHTGGSCIWKWVHESNSDYELHIRAVEDSSDQETWLYDDTTIVSKSSDGEWFCGGKRYACGTVALWGETSSDADGLAVPASSIESGCNAPASDPDTDAQPDLVVTGTGDCAGEFDGTYEFSSGTYSPGSWSFTWWNEDKDIYLDYWIDNVGPDEYEVILDIGRSGDGASTYIITFHSSVVSPSTICGQIDKFLLGDPVASSYFDCNGNSSGAVSDGSMFRANVQIQGDNCS